jgi:hypothetical protein
MAQHGRFRAVVAGLLALSSLLRSQNQAAVLLCHHLVLPEK